MSFSTDLGGIYLGRRDTIACFSEGGTTSSRKEVLYISAISGASSKANSLSTILGIPSGPGAFFCLPKGDVGFTHGYKEIGGG